MGFITYHLVSRKALSGALSKLLGSSLGTVTRLVSPATFTHKSSCVSRRGPAVQHVGLMQRKPQWHSQVIDAWNTQQPSNSRSPKILVFHAQRCVPFALYIVCIANVCPKTVRDSKSIPGLARKSVLFFFFRSLSSSDSSKFSDPNAPPAREATKRASSSTFFTECTLTTLCERLATPRRSRALTCLGYLNR